ncbi:hypothetical protein, variant 1 [Aphanomyces invadans]|uniref:PX domain-containing protein n=1 Tax=Aphanomyces invadans TaxID=157072 RepID=A0A024TQK5_9STRA|nr:hypothetical protein H310_10464 [Aphanomyces invadans]XP_008875087.1 hypothetical protein, variant 1 [Aphanomyces invadans]ETV96294.1 hypothetical protein H310_10464 [Aphanomyces invadans]ETV96295.1 hypothetical protein, variant 1 [Aphanomyces invadans]|eukprot:XP_008875086.1 hypothetical protein H310_10464 [Aphanomyces invadans]
MDTLAHQARELGRVEGRAESLEEIAALHAQIAMLHGKIEDMILAQGKRTKDLLSDVYKDIKATFKQHTDLLAPRQVVEICKPSLRRVAELHLGNPVSSPHDITPVPSSPLGHLHRSQSTFVTAAPIVDKADDVRSRRNSAPSQLSTDDSSLDPVLRQPSSSDPIAPSVTLHPVDVAVSGCEKVGSGHTAYMVYYVVVQKDGADVCAVKRRYKDFAWLWERLSAAHPFACVPSLPPKSSLLKSGQSRFHPVFTERRRRVLDRWLTHVALHEVVGRSPFVHAFLHDAVFDQDSISAPPSLPSPNLSLGPLQRQQRVRRTYKSLHEALPPLQKKLQMVAKRSDQVVKAHNDMASTMDGMRQYCYLVQSFERSQSNVPLSSTSPAMVPWEAWRAVASSHMRLHQDTALVWEVHLQEPFGFVHDHVLPRFERQLHDLGKDMPAASMTKMAVEWDELTVVRATTIVTSLIQAAMQLQTRHQSIVNEWMGQRDQLLQSDDGEPRLLPPKAPKLARDPSWDDAPPLIHPTLKRPLKPFAMTNVADLDDEVEAHELFGVAAAHAATMLGPTGAYDDDATAARTLFGSLESSSSSSEDDIDVHDRLKESAAPHTATSRDWDLYIERLRRKQITKAKRALAVQEEQAAAAAAAVAEEEALVRRMRKRPQSLNWPGKRSSNLRLDERVKHQQNQTAADIAGKRRHRSATSSLDEGTRQ